MSEIDITIGDARIVLRANTDYVIRSQGEYVKLSVTFNFDDVLHAVTRVAGAVLTEADQRRVGVALTQLRQQLANPERTQAIHDAYEHMFDLDCRHGTYTGGVMNGQPYAACEREAIAALRALHEAATPGPWTVHNMADDEFDSKNKRGWWWVWQGDTPHYAGVMEVDESSTSFVGDERVGERAIGGAAITDYDDGDREHADAALIAAMRNALPELLAAAEAVERVKALHQPDALAPTDYCDCCDELWPCPTVRALGGEQSE